MSFKIIPPKLAKKDLLALYDITHPTLREWLRRAGLHEFIGRRKFLAHELVLIFQHLGRPRLARSAAQRLKDVYARIRGILPDEVRFREKYKREFPPQRQDQLEDSKEELDAPQVFSNRQLQNNEQLYIWDAIARLTATAIYLLGQKARKQEAQRAVYHNSIGRKRLAKTLHRQRRLRA